MRTQKLLRATVICTIMMITSGLAAQVGNLSGIVSYHNDGVRLLEGVTVNLKSPGGTVLATTTTNAAGQYMFANLPYGTYRISADYSAPAGGISMADALLIVFHNAGLIQLNSYQLLAADVNGNGVVNMQDFVAIVSHYLVHGIPFPAGPWVFEEKIVEHDGLKSFWPKGTGGSSTADVGGDFEPGNKSFPVPLFLAQERYVGLPGDIAEIAVRMKEHAEITGYALFFSYPENLAEIAYIESSMPGVEYSVSNGTVRITVMSEHGTATLFDYGDELLKIGVRLLPEFGAEDVVRFAFSNESHFVNKNAELFTQSISVPFIEYDRGQNELFPNYPNPVVHSTTISYKLAEPARVHLAVYDMQGRVIATLVNAYQESGVYHYEYKPGSLRKGSYLLRLHTQGSSPHTQTHIMIVK